RVPTYLPDIQQEPRWLNQRLAREGDLHAFAGIPLISGDTVVGVLAILFGERREFTHQEKDLMTLLADHAAIAINNARLLEVAERRRRAAEALAEVGQAIAQSLDLEEVGQRIVDSVRGLFGAKYSTLFRLEPGSGALVVVAGSAEAGFPLPPNQVFPKGTGATGLAVRDREFVITPDVLDDPRITLTPEVRGRIEQAGYRAVLAMPLLVEGRVIGALGVGDRRRRMFDDDEIRLARSFADQAALALERARLYREVRDTRDSLRSIAENSADAILTTDVHGRITYASPGATDISGYSVAEALGLRVGDFYAGGLSEARAVMERLRAEERISNYETAIRGKDGRRVEVSVSFSLLRDLSGAIVGTVAVVRDVTEQKRLEEHLRQSQKMEAVGRLAGGIAHDFNNLMTIIAGRAEMLLGRLRPDDPLHRDIELFQKTSERAAALTRQLLAFSRRQVLQPRVLDLNAVVAGTDSMLRRLIGEDIDLVTVPEPALWPVKADPGQLEQVIVNLAVNARDAMPNGGKLTIETGNAKLGEGYASQHVAVKPGSFVVLAVSDTGMGMDEETRSRIFEPFFTTKERGRGTGLGLATVYGIVKQSGGNIWCYSEPGRGTTFKVYLPRVDEPLESPDLAAAAPAPQGGEETVLLVEDEEELRGVAREILEMHGYTVLEAGHPDEAVRIAERHAGPIHLLVTDVVMPKMSGRDLVQCLAPLRPGTKVLYISGYTDDAIVHHGVLDPGTAFLEKPFNPDDLARKVREALGQA
ncbi:MAG: GAF domain-containing protein, partial [Candidatus Rokubacteria bacterium]|nr:GAF domain-containing protein [Candidatus Rokubacteria bacterium]